LGIVLQVTQTLLKNITVITSDMGIFLFLTLIRMKWFLLYFMCFVVLE